MLCFRKKSIAIASLRCFSTIINHGKSKPQVQYKLVKQSGNKYTLEKGKEICKTPKIFESTSNFSDAIKNKYDAVIIGAGHNGLVCANYLAKEGKKVLVIEKRHQVGGCAVTEELVEGYKFSRCSYVLSLFRKKVIEELFGNSFFKDVKLLPRNPNGLTPSKEVGNYLLRRTEKELLKKELAKFSEKDANNIEKFEEFLGRMVKLIDPLLDMPPPEKLSPFDRKTYNFLLHLFKHRNDLYDFYHFLTSSAEYYLDKYFENDRLKATLATDAVIGAMKGPQSTGSAYVLLHHVMGNLDEKGSWFYVQGGNGALSTYIANKAVEKGVTIALNTPVEKFIVNQKNISIEGVIINNIETGEIMEIKSDIVVTNCDMYTTYFKLMEESDRKNLLSDKFNKSLELMDYNSPVMKINLIVNKLPQFKCFNDLIKTNSYQGDYEKLAKDHLTGTIHFNCESVKMIQEAYVEALSGKPSTKPIIEMTMPSLVDDTLVPKNSGHHVIGLFVQYAPNKLNSGSWTQQRKRDYANKVYDEIEKYCPGFTDSILFDDILSPADLESEFSITGGNIFHGVMDLNSIFFCRPFYGNCSYKQPIKNLYSCSSGMHPGGGVMGAPGRNCALTILNKI